MTIQTPVGQITLLTVTLVLAACTTPGSTPLSTAQDLHRSAPRQDWTLPRLAAAWLLDNCGTTETNRLDDKVRRHGRALEPFFALAARRGPAPALRRDNQAAAAARFEAAQLALASAETFGLDQQTLAELRSQNRQQYLARVARNFDLAYRSQAIKGLGLVGTTTAQDLLQKIASNPDSPLQGTARDALAGN